MECRITDTSKSSRGAARETGRSKNLEKRGATGPIGLGMRHSWNPFASNWATELPSRAVRVSGALIATRELGAVLVTLVPLAIATLLVVPFAGLNRELFRAENRLI